MNKTKALKILEELQKRQPIDLLNGPLSFKEQTDFINDPAKLKFALTCRRAGKSYAAALMLMHTCHHNDTVSTAYIGLTRDSAKNVIIPHLKEIKKNSKIPCTFKKSPAEVQFPNGSNIKFFGINDTEDEREKLLGQHFKLAVIDESASYTIDLKATITDFIQPTLWDDEGQLVLIGTPGNLRNYFCEISEGRIPGWSGHFWLADKNPKVSKQYLNEIIEQKKLYPRIDEDPGFQQHYLGKWTIDPEMKLYKASINNYIDSFNQSDYNYILAMDLGWTDANSFIIGAYHENDKYLYIVESFSKSQMLLDETISKINELESKYNISQFIIDSANKQYVEELRYRTRKPFQAATKPEKLKYIHMMNSDFICDKIKIVKPNCNSLLKEYDALTKLNDTSENYQTVIGNQDDHNADAALYLWRASFHYMAQPKTPKVPINSEQKVDEFWEKEEQKLNNKIDQTFFEKDWQ